MEFFMYVCVYSHATYVCLRARAYVFPKLTNTSGSARSSQLTVIALEALRNGILNDQYPFVHVFLVHRLQRQHLPIMKKLK